jgi:hypothetical protein
LDVEVASAYAPEVVTAGWNSEFHSEDAPTGGLLEVAFPMEPEIGEKLAAANVNPARFLALGEDTSLYRGNVLPSAPVRVTKKLAVTGNCHFPAGSVIEADVKASGSIFLEPSCVIKGNLVADRDVFLGTGCRFSGLIHAGKAVLLSRGTRGFRVDGMVAIYAGDRLSVESEVGVRGKLASGECVVVANAASSKAWKTRRGIGEV